MTLITNLIDFAKLLNKVLDSDRDIILSCGGMTGEGKSSFSSQLLVQYGIVSGTNWFYDYMTWSRKEFLGWVLGDKNNKRVKEKTGILLDELFSMFYSRNWHLDQQKEAIGLLNMCRDRHLLIVGNVPNFWSLDKGFLNRVRYYVYIPRRGVAWIFEQEINPFSTDPWNITDNKKYFRKNKGAPYKLPNFVAEIPYNDWPQDEKNMYYEIRNKKRIMAQDDIIKEEKETYTKIKKDRDNLIKAMHLRYNIPQKDITSLVSLKKSAVSNICLGIQ